MLILVLFVSFWFNSPLRRHEQRIVFQALVRRMMLRMEGVCACVCVSQCLGLSFLLPSARVCASAEVGSPAGEFRQHALGVQASEFGFFRFCRRPPELGQFRLGEGRCPLLRRRP